MNVFHHPAASQRAQILQRVSTLRLETTSNDTTFSLRRATSRAAACSCDDETRSFTPMVQTNNISDPITDNDIDVGGVVGEVGGFGHHTPSSDATSTTTTSKFKSLNDSTNHHNITLLPSLTPLLPTQHTDINDVTQKLASTHVNISYKGKQPAVVSSNINQTTSFVQTLPSFPQPGGAFLGREVRSTTKHTMEYEYTQTPKKQRRSAVCLPPGTTFVYSKDTMTFLTKKTHSSDSNSGEFNMNEGALFNSTTPAPIKDTSSTPCTRSYSRRPLPASRRTKENKRQQRMALGDIYDYQLNRLAMNPKDRHLHSPKKTLDGISEDEDDSCFTPIAFRLSGNNATVEYDESNESKSAEESTQNNSFDDDKLLTPVDIFFGYEDANRPVEESQVDVDDNPFAEFARNYLN